jgi:hypothetical protein
MATMARMTTTSSAAAMMTAAVGLSPKIVVRSVVVERGSADPPSLFDVSGVTVVLEDEEDPALGLGGLAGLDGLDELDALESAFESGALGAVVESPLSAAGADGLVSDVEGDAGDGLLPCWADTPATMAIRNSALRSTIRRRFMSHLLLGAGEEQGWCRQGPVAQGARR